MERPKLPGINRNHERFVGLADAPELNSAQGSYLRHDRVLFLFQPGDVGTLLGGGHFDAILLGIGADRYDERIAGWTKSNSWRPDQDLVKLWGYDDVP